MNNAIDTFLANWKQSAKGYYVLQVETYNKLVSNKNKLMEKYNLYTIRNNQDLPQDYVEAKNAFKAYTESKAKSDLQLIQRCVYANNPNNPTETLDSFLEKLLNKEVENKKATLIKKIESKAGQIIDAKNLYIGADGNINGYVIGNIKQVNVETIYAGGYNIQCLHYRVLVK